MFILTTNCNEKTKTIQIIKSIQLDILAKKVIKNSSMFVEILSVIVALLLYLYYNLTKNKNHWRDRNVPSTKFRFFWGDDSPSGDKSLHDIMKEEYFRHPGERMYGGWSLMGVPYLMIRNDFELMRAIWIKDFDHFNQTRVTEFAEKIWCGSREESMMLNTIQTMHGEAWKDIRYKSGMQLGTGLNVGYDGSHQW